MPDDPDDVRLIAGGGVFQCHLRVPGHTKNALGASVGGLADHIVEEYLLGQHAYVKCNFHKFVFFSF